MIDAHRVRGGNTALGGGTMIAAWVVSFNKEVPARPQTGPQVWYIYS